MNEHLVAQQIEMELERSITMTKTIDKPNAVGNDDFLAKKSSSYKTDIADDKDVWCEYLAVVEMVVPSNSGTNKTKDRELYELEIKSFFESTLTGKRTWDEPPSGATTIQYASDEDHQRAENERVNLQTTTRTFANDSAQPKEGILSKLNVFRKWRNRKSRQGSAPDQRGRTDMIKGTNLNTTVGVTSTRQKTQSQEQQEFNLDEQDAIAMAQALSLSEADVKREREREQEDTMLNVLYDSKTGAFSGATGLAYAAGSAGGKDGLLDVLEDEDNNGMIYQDDVWMKDSEAYSGKSDNQDYSNSKMPAV